MPNALVERRVKLNGPGVVGVPRTEPEEYTIPEGTEPETKVITPAGFPSVVNRTTDWTPAVSSGMTEGVITPGLPFVITPVKICENEPTELVAVTVKE
jgi:hypothetical protein